jgi:hypothetical protein
MLSERRFRIFAKALFIEMLQLWRFAVQPPHRIPEAIVAQRQREYFRLRLAEAIHVLCVNSAALAEVLVEIILVATGEEEIVGWRPPPLCHGEALDKPLASR